MRYETKRCFNVRSKGYTSQLDLTHESHVQGVPGAKSAVYDCLGSPCVGGAVHAGVSEYHGIGRQRSGAVRVHKAQRQPRVDRLHHLAESVTRRRARLVLGSVTATSSRWPWSTSSPV